MESEPSSQEYKENDERIKSVLHRRILFNTLPDSGMKAFIDRML